MEKANIAFSRHLRDYPLDCGCCGHCSGGLSGLGVNQRTKAIAATSFDRWPINIAIAAGNERERERVRKCSAAAGKRQHNTTQTLNLVKV